MVTTKPLLMGRFFCMEYSPKQKKRIEQGLKIAKGGVVEAFQLLMDLQDESEANLKDVKDKIDTLETKTLAGQGDKGDKGDKGDMGPQGPQGETGPEGKPGKDGKNGVNGSHGLDGIDGIDGRDGLNGKDGKDGSPDTPDDIRNKLESLKEESRLDAKAIKNLPQFTREIVREGGRSGAYETPVKNASTGKLFPKDATGAYLISTSSGLIVTEVDGAPSGTPTTLKFSNGAVTDNGDGSFTVTTGSGGGGDFSSNTSTSVDSEVVVFSGTGGKTGKRATGTGIATLTSGVLSATATTGSGSVVLATSPTLVTPVLGVAAATTINKVTLTAPATGSTLTIDDGFTLHATGNVTALSGSSTGANTGDQTITLTGGVTGSGTGSFAATVITNANLTGPITSSGNATAIASQTGTGTKFVVDTSPTLVTPALGVATATSLAIGGATIGSNGLAVTGHLLVEGVTSTGATGTGKLVFDTAPQISTIELGNASDTTLSRSAGGVLAVEGVVVDTISATNTLTNKRITRRVVTVSGPGATPSTNTDNVDIAAFTALAAAITSMTTNLSGTPVNGDMVMFQFTDNGTSRAITWGASFASTTSYTLPTATVISTLLRVLVQWNSTSSKWECIGTA